MNFLAHLYLSPPTPDALLGALLGDFVKGPVEHAGYNPEITAAIRLHRAIDTFTDAHPIVLASKARISPARRRYASILVDVFYDHFLARDWRRFHPEPLERFAASTYLALSGTTQVLPDRMAHMLPHLVAGDWLTSYRELDGIHLALDRMSRRVRPGNPLLGSAAELEAQLPAFEADFHAFFEQLRGWVAADITPAADRSTVDRVPAPL